MTLNDLKFRNLKEREGEQLTHRAQDRQLREELRNMNHYIFSKLCGRFLLVYICDMYICIDVLDVVAASGATYA